MTHEELKGCIKCVHKLWYGKESWTTSPTQTLKLHRHMEALFNYAEITDSLIENNPGKLTPSDFKDMTGAKE